MVANIRLVLAAAVAALVGCATTPEPPPPAPAPEPAPAPAPISSVAPVVPAAKPAPAKSKTKPKKGAEKPADVAAARAADAATATPAEVPAPEPLAHAEPEIKGPAWLAKCASKRYEGGVIRCDADSLLANPSGNIKVYARDENLAGPVANGGRIEYRPGLPRRYRLFVFP